MRVIKNPVSLCESIKELNYAKNTKVVFCVEDPKKNNNSHWIFDSNFKALENFNNKIYVTGNCFDDMTLRLKYAQVNPSLIIMDGSIKNAIRCCYWDLEKKENELESKINKGSEFSFILTDVIKLGALND